MACKYCSSDWFWEKLGRCKQCMLLNTLLFLVGVLGSWWTMAMTPVYHVMCLFITVAAGLLLSAHLIMACYYYLQGESNSS